MNWKVIAAIAGIVVAIGAITWLSCSGGEDPRLRVRPAPPDEDVAAPSAPAVAANRPGGPPAPAAPSVPASAPPSPASAARPLAANPAVAESGGWTLPLSTGPSHPLPSAELRRRLALVRLSRIALALNEYAAVNRTLPPQAHYDGDQPLLSWRVLLLPYLGYGNLYAQFHLNEPWDSPHNAALLNKIPPVYQSPDRADDRTNFLVPHGDETLFSGQRGVIPNNAPDGISATVLVLEADNEMAVRWTEPRDFPVKLNQPVRGLGRLRGDGAFVAWGDGLVGTLPAASKPLDITAALTGFGEESLNIAALIRPASITAPAVAAVASPADIAASADPLSPLPGPVGVLPGPTSAAPPRPVMPGLDSPDGLMLLADAALRGGKPTEGMQLLHAALLTGDAASGQLDTMRWIPALKRPSLGVRWGVGMQGSGAGSAMPITWPGKPRATRAIKMPAQLSQYVGEVGERTLERMLDARDAGKFGPLLAGFAPTAKATSQTRPNLGLVAAIVGRETTRKLEPIEPGFVYVGGGTQKQLVDLSRQEGLDALVLFDIELKPIRGGSSQTTTVRLIELSRNETLASSASLNSLAVKRMREMDPGADDPVVSGLERVFNCLDQQFTATDLPPALQAEHVERRIEALLAESNRDPLALLAEARLYHHKKLLPDARLLQVYQRILGDVRGSQLFAGSFPQKMEALNGLLPQFKPTATTTARTVGFDEE